MADEDSFQKKNDKVVQRHQILTGDPDCERDKVSVNFFRNWLKKMGLRFHNAGVTTDARADAEVAIAHCVTYAAAMNYLVPQIKPALILNMDATQLGCGDSTKEK